MQGWVVEAEHTAKARGRQSAHSGYRGTSDVEFRLHPVRASVVYMMSSRQVLFPSPLPEGRRVGAWHPHLMIAMPNVTETQLGFEEGGSAGGLQLDHGGEAEAQLIVPVPSWADSVPAAGSR